jgi:hypothetical protein
MSGGSLSTRAQQSRFDGCFSELPRELVLCIQGYLVPHPCCEQIHSHLRRLWRYDRRLVYLQTLHPFGLLRKLPKWTIFEPLKAHRPYIYIEKNCTRVRHVSAFTEQEAEEEWAHRAASKSSLAFLAGTISYAGV